MNRIRNFVSEVWNDAMLIFCISILFLLLGMVSIIDRIFNGTSRDIDAYAHYHGGALRPNLWESFWESLGPRAQARLCALSLFFARFG